jgi:hypothetical protein
MSVPVQSTKSLAAKRKSRRIAMGLVLVIPFLYMLSSGLPVFLMSRGIGEVREVQYETQGGLVYATSVGRPVPILEALYSPLFWVARQAWGAPLQSYWELCYSDADGAE